MLANFTLDKINRNIKSYIKNKEIQLKILQTNSESKAISYLQKNRKKIDGIIIIPGPWQYSAYGLADLFELIEIPFITIAYKEKDYIKLLNGFDNLIELVLIRLGYSSHLPDPASLVEKIKASIDNEEGNKTILEKSSDNFRNSNQILELTILDPHGISVVKPVTR